MTDTERKTRLSDGRWLVSLDLTEQEHAAQVAFHEANHGYLGLGARVRVKGIVNGVVIAIGPDGYTVQSLHGEKLGPFARHELVQS